MKINQRTDIEWDNEKAIDYIDLFNSGGVIGDYHSHIEAWAYVIATGVCWELYDQKYAHAANAYIAKRLIQKDGTINWIIIDELELAKKN